MPNEISLGQSVLLRTEDGQVSMTVSRINEDDSVSLKDGDGKFVHRVLFGKKIGQCLPAPKASRVKVIRTTAGDLKIRKNGRMAVIISPGTKKAETVRVTPPNPKKRVASGKKKSKKRG